MYRLSVLIWITVKLRRSRACRRSRSTTRAFLVWRDTYSKDTSDRDLTFPRMQLVDIFDFHIFSLESIASHGSVDDVFVFGVDGVGLLL